LNRTKEASRARFSILFSILVFIFAAASTLIPKYGNYLALVLALFGGFLMMIGAIMRDQSRVPRKMESEPQTLEEQA